MSFLLICSIFTFLGSSVLVQADSEVLDFIDKSQNISYTAENLTLDPELEEEIFPEEYIRSHLGIKSALHLESDNDGAQGSGEIEEEVTEVVPQSGGDARNKSVVLWIGALLPWLVTLLL